MDEVSPGLWIGDLRSALDVDGLRAHGIHSILSAMRGKLTIKETFLRLQILLDDAEDADILCHIFPSIRFIQSQLDKGRGVLVHCHAGISRSATIVAAYLMYSKNLDREAALDMIRNVRPSIDPNGGFLRQLEIFHKAQFKVSHRDKTTRMFYLERAHDEVMNGDGSLSETDMFAKFPLTPSDSAPSTPGGPRRRIRCKMCRQELAAREHMLDHGELGPATPSVRSPASSRRPSGLSSHRPSMNQARPSVGVIAESRPLRLSTKLGDSLVMSAIEPEGNNSIDNRDVITNFSPSISALRRRSSAGENPSLRNLHEVDPSLSSALDEDSDDDDESRFSMVYGLAGMSDETAKILGRRMSDAVHLSLTTGKEASSDNIPSTTHPSDGNKTTLIFPVDLVAELSVESKLAASRSQPFPSKQLSPISAPILANPKCSGYFVEPMKWMKPFLEAGQLAGKIVCPNIKCGAKLGNYDWAGVRCGCEKWVIPGFCLHRSKVDEIVAFSLKD